jgi:hypothetical protein
MKVSWISFIAVVMIFSSCKIETCDELIPEIEFKELIVIDSIRATLIIGFKDCDGDIGLEPTDTLPPFDYNLFLEYYYLENGIWILRDLSDESQGFSPFYYRIAPIENKASSDILEGEIEVALNGYNLEQSTDRPDTIKFSIMLRDQALNNSNIVETPPLVVF